MDVIVQYFADCPNWRVAEERLRMALERLGLPVEVGYEVVDTQVRAEAVGFRGSPTILINGSDPFADPSQAVGLSCRLYRTPDGIQGSPTVGQIAQAVESARSVRRGHVQGA